jgi:hypothetical protein
MMITSSIIRRTVSGACLAAAVTAWALALPSCSSESKQPDCVPADGAQPKKGGTYEMTPLKVEDADKKNNDWCRACVMGPNRFASCQRVYGDTPTEPREAIRERARIKACVDSGFKADACPAAATIGIACKGDPPPPNAGNPAKILQDMYQQMNPAQANPKGAAPPSPADPSKPVLQ